MVVRERSGAVLLATSSFLCGVRGWMSYNVQRAFALLGLWTRGRMACNVFAGCVLCCSLRVRCTAWPSLDMGLIAASSGASGAWRLHSHWELSVDRVAFMVGVSSLQRLCDGVCSGGETVPRVVVGVVHSTYGQHALAARLDDAPCEYCQYARWSLC